MGHGHHDYGTIRQIPDHLQENDDEKNPQPTMNMAHDPWAFKYGDVYVHGPPSKWLHSRIRSQYGAGADPSEKTLQNWWKFTREAWTPSWRVFRFDTHNRKAAHRVEFRGTSALTGGTSIDDFVHVSMVGAVGDPKKIEEAAEDELLKCKERTISQLKDHEEWWNSPHRLSQITHRDCVFTIWANLIAAGKVKDHALQIPTTMARSPWWYGFRAAPFLAPVGPFKTMTFTQWWAQDRAKEDALSALQLETHATVAMLSTAIPAQYLNGQPKDLFLNRLEKHYFENLLPKQKQLFNNSRWARDFADAAPSTGAELDKKRDRYFRNLHKSSNYSFEKEELERVHRSFVHNDYAQALHDNFFYHNKGSTW